jgi:hypothetical protein
MLGESLKKKKKTGKGGENTKCKSGESVHDEVDPQQLHCAEDRILVITGNSGNKGENNRSDVDGQLELNK